MIGTFDTQEENNAFNKYLKQRKKVRQASEESVQIAICNYIRFQYPNVIFNCDLASGMKLTIGQAVKAKKMRSSRGYPDLFIAKRNENYFGLYLELKKQGTKLFKKDGITFCDEHLREQEQMMKRLRCEGFEAQFAIGFDDAKTKIDNYLNQ